MNAEESNSRKRKFEHVDKAGETSDSRAPAPLSTPSMEQHDETNIDGDGDDAWGDLDDGDAEVVAVDDSGEFDRWRRLRRRWEAKDVEIRAELSLSLSADEHAEKERIKCANKLFSNERAPFLSLCAALEDLIRAAESAPSSSSSSSSSTSSAPPASTSDALVVNTSIANASTTNQASATAPIALPTVHPEVEAVDDNPYCWSVKYPAAMFPPHSCMATGLRRLQREFGFDFVEIQVQFEVDLFPIYPPTLRLTKPRLNDGMMARIVCMHPIQVSSWNAARSVSSILQAVFYLLNEHGQVQFDAACSEPADAASSSAARIDPFCPYSDLEFELLQLSSLSDCASLHNRHEPLIIDTLPSFAIRKGAAAAASGKVGSAAAALFTTSLQTSKKWAAGTGYGHGHQEDLDMHEVLRMQQRKDTKLLQAMQRVAQLLVLHGADQGDAATSVSSLVRTSCLLPLLQRQFCNDSLVDVRQHGDLYLSVFDVTSALAHWPHVFDIEISSSSSSSSSSPSSTGALPNTLLLCVRDLCGRFSNIRKAMGSPLATETAASAPASTSASDSAHAVLASGTLTFGTKKAAPTAVNSRRQQAEEEMEMRLIDASLTLLAHVEAQCAIKSSSSSSSSAEVLMEAGISADSAPSTACSAASTLADYVRLLAPLRYDVVEDFRSHHYQATSIHAGRPLIRRLAQEFTDLSRSLPLNVDSSVFLRTKESALNFAQMLIIAPDATPYARGVFLFDVAFPSEYPNAPPKVNLQTTGAGSVRFNPNLYNCGKVCLSLLGTWQGNQGESWSAATSTFLQVAVSIQSLIFVPQPYFNEPSYEATIGTPHGEAASRAYNDNIRLRTMQWAMIDHLRNPPQHFEAIVKVHFQLHRETILRETRAWVDEASAISRDAFASAHDTLRELLAALE